MTFNGTAFSKAQQDESTALRMRAGFQSTMEARKNYLNNKDSLTTTNECFVPPGGKPAMCMKLTSTDFVASRVGKPSNFFSLRE